MFKLEQSILDCWGILDTLKQLNLDQRSAMLNSIIAVYEMKFEQLWSQFERTAQDYRPGQKSQT